MHRLLVVYFAATLAALLFMSPVAAQEDAVDPLAYTPTGDELYDTYAQALLELLENARPFQSMIQVAPPSLSSELLDNWEDEFGNDPRYWQLRYWDANWQTRVQEHASQYPAIEVDQDLDPGDFLEQGVERGASDVITEMLLFKYRRQALKASWDQFCDGTLPEDSDFAPAIREGASGFSWFMEEELYLVDQLVADCPDESWAWYESAMTRFNYGEWEAGLNDLRKGNEAANNRLPLPFPISFINERIANDLHCGNDVAAGMALQGISSGSWLSFHFKIKDQMRNQIVRMKLGAPLSEFEPWHQYTCRYGSMAGAGSLQWSVARIVRNTMLEHLLVDTPESFTVDQRDSFLELYGRLYKIRELANDAFFDTDSLGNDLRVEFEKRGINVDESPNIAQTIMYLANMKELTMVGNAVYFRWQFEKHNAEHGKLFRKAAECFGTQASFDFTNYSWPPPE